MRKIESRTTASGTAYFIRFRLNGKQTSETFDRKRDAEEFAKVLDALGPQGAVDWLYAGAGEQKADVPTLDQVAADHVRLVEGVSPGYRKKEQRRWDNQWSPRIGNLRADLVSRDALKAALNDLAENGQGPGKGYARKSLSNARGLLHGVMERCVEEGHLPSNPAKKLRLPDGQFTIVTADHVHDDDDDDKVFLTLGEFRALYLATAVHYRPLVRFLAGTGLRWGEITALQRRDVVLDGPEPSVRVRRAWKESGEGGEAILGPPKTKRSRRTVILSSELVADLRELVRGKGPNDWVFTAPKGGIVRHRTFWGQHWRPAIFRAQHCADHLEQLRVKGCLCWSTTPARCQLHRGKDGKVVAPTPCYCDGTLIQTPRIHDMRHSHASWLLAQGIPLHVVRDRLGHESIQTTVNVYGHLLPDMRLAAAQAASLMFETTPEIEAPRSLETD